jgi:hypothetical protein
MEKIPLLETLPLAVQNAVQIGFCTDLAINQWDRRENAEVESPVRAMQ